MSDKERLQEAIERGMTRARQEDWPAAEDSFRRAVGFDSQSVEACFRLGWALWNRAGQIECQGGKTSSGPHRGKGRTHDERTAESVFVSFFEKLRQR